MKQNIAVFQSEYGLSTFTKDMEPYTQSVRLTEYVEVEFPKLPIEIVVGNQVYAIDKKIESIKEKAMTEVAALQARKTEWLALTHEVAS